MNSGFIKGTPEFLTPGCPGLACLLRVHMQPFLSDPETSCSADLSRLGALAEQVNDFARVASFLHGLWIQNQLGNCPVGRAVFGAVAVERQRFRRTLRGWQLINVYLLMIPGFKNAMDVDCA